MMNPVRQICVILILLLLGGCTSHSAAPVGSRSTEQSRPVSMSKQPVSAPQAGYYTVRRGDTLYSIAWQHGLNYRQLAAMNSIRPPYTIYAGQRLQLRPGSYTRVSARPIPASRPKTSIPAQPSVSPAKPARAVAPAPAVQPKPGSQPKETSLPARVADWVWPARGPLLHGYRPASGKKGIDIGGTAGQSVKAAAAGKVVYSGSGLVGYGRLIIIKHNDRLLSAYGHNSKLLVQEGERVEAGQTIAKMGSSGTDRTQLYFEIREDGKPVNPLRYLPRG